MKKEEMKLKKKGNNLMPYVFLLVFIIGCMILVNIKGTIVKELSASEFMKALDENVIRAKYPEEIANKMISTDAELRPMIEENNQGFAIKIEHLHFITKDKNQATSFVHVDKNAEAGVKIIKELKCC